MLFTLQVSTNCFFFFLQTREAPPTEDAGHDGDAWVLGLALGIVHPQGLEGGQTDGLGAP